MKKIFISFLIFNLILTNFLCVTLAFIVDGANLNIKNEKIIELFYSIFITPYLIVSYVILFFCVCILFFIRSKKDFSTFLIVNLLSYTQIYLFLLLPRDLLGLKYAMVIFIISIFSTAISYCFYKKILKIYDRKTTI